MNVLVLSTMYPNSVLYLSGVFVHEQVKALNSLGVTCTVFAPIPYSLPILSGFKQKWKLLRKVPAKEMIDDITIYHTKYLAIPGGFLKHFWGILVAYNIYRQVKKEKSIHFDLIHAHGSLPDDHAAMLLSKWMKIPFIVTVHGATVYSTIKRKTYFNKSKQALSSADAVVCVSSKVLDILKQRVDVKQKSYVIWNGFNKPEQKNSEFNENSRIKVMFGAALIERKGCRYLLDAFNILSSKLNNIELIIAGGGILLDTLKNYSKELGVNNIVRFEGTVKHNRMLELMEECDIFALPSWDEAFGVVYLEAMSFKKPVIATIGEGITDIIEDGKNGLLTKPRNVESLADKLEILISDPTYREKIGNAGYKSIRNLSWVANASKNIEVYKKISN